MPYKIFYVSMLEIGRQSNDLNNAMDNIEKPQKKSGSLADMLHVLANKELK